MTIAGSQPRAGADGLSVFGGDKDDKKKIESILQDTWKALTTGFIRIALKAGAHFQNTAICVTL